MAQSYDHYFILLVVGDWAVSKSSFTSMLNLSEETCNSSYWSTLGIDIQFKTVDINGKKIKLEIRKTQHNGWVVSVNPYQGVMGVMLVYDVTNEESFKNINHLMADIRMFADPNIEVMIIGNKCDLSDQQVVTKERAQLLAAGLGIKLFMEINAKDDDYVEKALLALTDKITKKLDNRKAKQDTVKDDKKILMHNLSKAKRDHGIIPMRFLKIIVAGSGSAGKTNFINLLMQKEFELDHHSTTAVHTNHAVSFQMATFQESSTVDSEVTWVELDTEFEVSYLQSLLLPKTLPKSKLPVPHAGTVEKKDAVTLGPLSAPVRLQYHSRTPKQQQPILKWFTGLFVRSVTDSNLSTFDSILSKKSSQSSASIPKPNEVVNIITLLDTGGQPEYIHLFPTININPTVTFVVHNLCKGLDDQVLVEYSQHGKHMFTPYYLSYSNLDMIKFLMSAVNDSVERHTFNASDFQLAVTPSIDDKSYICMVGTHADKVSQTERNVASKGILSLTNKTQCQALVWYQDDRNVLFAVDNTTAGHKYLEDPVAKDMRKRIETLASKKEVYEIPITWMLLQLEVRQVCSKRKRSYISFSDCVAIAKSSGLISSPEEAKSILKFYHLIGVLIYFHEVPGLCDYVIVDHQWWFDKLSSVISITFQEHFLNYQAVQKLKYQGLLSKDLVKHIEWEDGIKEEYFFSLLIQMKIITPVMMKQNHIEEYFVPFVLSAYNLQSENKILSQYGHLQGQPLLIQFSSGILPRGLFCSLIVQLLQYPFTGSELHFSQEDKQHAFSNLFTFSLPNAYSMSLLDKLSYLEVQIRHPKKAFDDPVHSKLYKYLTYLLTDVCNHLKFNTERLRYGFICKCCKHAEYHIAILPSISHSTVYARCSIDSTYQMELSSSHLIWFHDDQCLHCEKNSDNDWEEDSLTNHQQMPAMKRPNMRLLHEIVVPRIAAKWDHVAIYLRYEVEYKQLIKERCHHDPERCCLELLEDWLCSNRGVTPKSWSKLIEVLREIKSLKAATAKIVEDLATAGVLV